MAVLGKRRGEQALPDRLSAASVSKPAAIGDRHHDQGFVRPGRAATDTVIVSKCGNGQESSLYPSGT